MEEVQRWDGVGLDLVLDGCTGIPFWSLLEEGYLAVELAPGKSGRGESGHARPGSGAGAALLRRGPARVPPAFLDAHLCVGGGGGPPRDNGLTLVSPFPLRPHCRSVRRGRPDLPRTTRGPDHRHGVPGGCKGRGPNSDRRRLGVCGRNSPEQGPMVLDTPGSEIGAMGLRSWRALPVDCCPRALRDPVVLCALQPPMGQDNTGVHQDHP